VEWYDKNHNNLHLNRKELSTVRTAYGFWDKDYAEVVNAVLPFEKCVAHLGAEGWGRESYSIADLQMRIYFVEWSLGRVKGRVLDRGRRAATAILRREMGLSDAKEASVVNDNVGGWERSVVQFDIRHSDPVDEIYGTAIVEFYMRKLGGHTMVLVFMRSSPEAGADDIRAIQASVTAF
jgi:hypothetical protein